MSRGIGKKLSRLPHRFFSSNSYDLFGDGTIILFPLPLHSKGMTGIKVGTEKDYLIIAGDCGYGKESYENLSLPGIAYDKKEALKSLKTLKTIAFDKKCQAILMTHDREVTKKEYEIED